MRVAAVVPCVSVCVHYIHYSSTLSPTQGPTQWLLLDMNKKIKMLYSYYYVHVWCNLAFKLTTISYGTKVSSFLLMTEPSKLARKDIVKYNAG